MASSQKIYNQLTGPEKNRFIQEMGQKEYDKLVNHLRKVLKMKDSKEEKLIVPDGTIRKAYYTASDGAIALTRAVEVLNDPELTAQVKELQDKVDQIYKTLDKKYRWD